MAKVWSCLINVIDNFINNPDSYITITSSLCSIDDFNS